MALENGANDFSPIKEVNKTSGDLVMTFGNDILWSNQLSWD
jgi:hypothetical protein